MIDLIRKLVETSGPSGYEDEIRELIRAEIVSSVDEVRVDALGNLIARKGKRAQNGRRIMIAAHMDEIGIIATHVDDNGFVRFTTVGYVNPLTCVGGRVRFLNGSQGVVQCERLDSSEKPSIEKLYIDLGVRTAQESPVRVGDLATFDRPLIELGSRLVSKAMDNRISVAVVIEALRKIGKTPNELYFVFTTQEEVGTRGVTSAAYGVDPEVGFAVDVTLTGDTPKGVKMEVSLGKGPAIKVRDSGMLSDPRVVRWMTDTARREKIPFQLEVLEGGSTDARSIQVTRMGVPAGCVSIPCRYVHTPSEMVDMDDLQNSVRLIAALLSQPVEIG